MLHYFSFKSKCHVKFIFKQNYVNFCCSLQDITNFRLDMLIVLLRYAYNFA